MKPAGVTWGVDERPPALVLWVSAVQHVRPALHTGSALPANTHEYG